MGDQAGSGSPNRATKPRALDLFINLKTAKSLWFELSPTLLARADHGIA